MQKKFKYLLNVTFYAGSDTPEDTDRDMFLITVKKPIFEEDMKEAFKKANSLLDTFNDKVDRDNFPLSYDDGLNINTLMQGVALVLEGEVSETYSNMGHLEADDYYVIEQWQ